MIESIEYYTENSNFSNHLDSFKKVLKCSIILVGDSVRWVDMKLEYLIETEEQLKIAKSLNFEGLLIEIKNIPEKQISLMILTHESNGLEAALFMSKVHDEIMQKSDFSILTNGSSQYFLKALFPKVNDLEYKLRKLLHIASSLNNESDMEEGKKYIKKLENETLGRIFDFLFTDSNLNDKFRNVFNDKIEKVYKEVKVSRPLTKKNYLKYLEKFEEKTPWQQLLGNRVPTLMNRYLDIELARNDIAHAHNISSTVFSKHKYLFEKVIKELDSAIYDLENSEMKYNEIDSFNEVFKNTYKKYEILTRNLDNEYFFNNIMPISNLLGKFKMTDLQSIRNKFTHAQWEVLGNVLFNPTSEFDEVTGNEMEDFENVESDLKEDEAND